jgi:hypothetical protein
MITGEAGIGKTRCAEELALEARAKAVTVWTGRCLEADGAPAFWPWIQILREMLREEAGSGREGSERAQGVDGPDRVPRALAESLLAELVPRDGAALEPEFMNGRSDAFWLADRMAGLLIESAKTTPRLLVLDDIQWGDASSLRVVELLAAQLEKNAIVVVATLRDTDVPRDSTLARSLARLARHLTPVPLARLARADVEEYLTRTIGGPRTGTVADDVYRTTGGNPLFVEQMAHRLVDRPDGGVGDLADFPGARAFILARLKARDARVLPALEAASILGDRFELPVLAALVGSAVEPLVDLLAQAVDARLVRSGAGGHYDFEHGLIREAILSGIAPAERSQLHRRAGEALEARAVGDERLTQLAFHFWEGLAAGAHVEAARYGAAAAHAAQRVFAHDEALVQWKRVLDALAYATESDATARCRALLGLASAERHLARRVDSRKHAKQALALARHRDDPALLVEAASVLRHSMLSHLGIDPAAREALVEALPKIVDPRQRATALSLLAAGTGGRATAENLRGTEEALKTARAMGGQALLEALWGRTFMLTGPGDTRALLETSHEMLGLDTSLGRSWWSGEAHYAALCAYAYRGDMAAVRHALDELAALAVSCRFPEAEWHTRRLRAQLAFQAGAFDEAERSWTALASDPLLAGIDYVKALDHMQRLALAAETEDGHEASYALWQVLSRWSTSARIQSMHVASRIDAGDRVQARALFGEMAEGGFARLGEDRLLLACWAALAKAAVALEDRDRAVELEGVLAPYASFNAVDVLTSSLGSVAHYLAILSAFLGDAGRAIERFELALTRNREMGLRPRLAETELAFARFLAARSTGRGSAGRARALAESAAATAKELGMRRVAREAQALLRQLA